MPGVRGLPSVTEVMDSVGLGFSGWMPPARREWALARGAALHAAIALDAEGALDDASVHPEIAGQLDAYRKWVAATQHVVLASEIELVHSRWQYVGHPDRVGLVGGKVTLIDWKHSVDRDYCALQMGGYAPLVREAFPDTPVEQYVALSLSPDGNYSTHVIVPDEQTFLACLLVHRAREARKKVPA